MSEEDKKEIVETDKKELANVEVDINPFIRESCDRSLEVLSSLNKLSLVTPNEVALMKEAQSFIIDSYVDVPSHRTLVQKNVGVLTDARFQTPDAKYWQCKKEAEVQYEELVDAYINYQALLVDVKEMLWNKGRIEKEINKTSDSDIIIEHEFNLERIDLKLQSYNMKLKKLEKEIKYRISEISDWYHIAEEWKLELKHGEHNYNRHEMENLALALKSQIATSKAKGDMKTAANFQQQLDTIERIVKERLKKSKEA